MLEDGAKFGDESFAAHLGRTRITDMGVLCRPMIRNLLAGGEPHILVAVGIFKKLLKRLRATGASHKAAVQANRHHATTFRVEHIETSF